MVDMTDWLSANASTLFVAGVLVVLIAVAVAVMHKNRKTGRSTCGGSCSGCPMGADCHRNKKSEA